MSLLKNIGVIAMSMAFLGGCKDVTEDNAVSSVARAAVVRNGLFVNGLFVNGLVINGMVINGLVINGMVINGLVINGLVTNGLVTNGLVTNGLVLKSVTLEAQNFQGNKLSLNGSLLSATDGTRTLTGTQLINAILHYDIVDSTGQRSPLALRIEDVQLDPSVASKDVWVYKVTYRPDLPNTQTPWTTLCVNEQNQPDTGIPLAGHWDPKTGDHVENPNTFTLACRDFALGKCVTLGYRPWAKGTACTGGFRSKDCRTVSLADHHQACTRMVRADYCGNGTSYTVNGTLIDVYDYLQPPLNVPETDWDIESRWTPSGALCLSEPRHPELLVRWRWPDCNGDGKADAMVPCRDDPTLRNRGMLVTRVQDVRPDHR